MCVFQRNVIFVFNFIDASYCFLKGNKSYAADMFKDIQLFLVMDRSTLFIFKGICYHIVLKFK